MYKKDVGEYPPSSWTVQEIMQDLE
jgi:hypothetical protein